MLKRELIPILTKMQSIHEHDRETLGQLLVGEKATVTFVIQESGLERPAKPKERI